MFLRCSYTYLLMSDTAFLRGYNAACDVLFFDHLLVGDFHSRPATWSLVKRRTHWHPLTLGSTMLFCCDTPSKQVDGETISRTFGANMRKASTVCLLTVVLCPA